ncbi:DUF4142 domain-containing protein [Bordetella sp. LUAb4]|uniref:DUF4142 domain-containing protein n=1 Tax=Bordetella sp. LUAb4 TaxID=2843195 RepID=UPI001E617458|nr:DUF4142 domain-containing protein [Bordetella sp. LUAb4]
MGFFKRINRTFLRNTAVCATLVMSASAAWNTQAAELSRRDQRFLLQAGQAGLFEIAASKLALDRSSNDDVKNFAQMMITDHTAVARDLQALADSKNTQLPTEPSRAQQSVLRQLQNSQRNRFDRAYAEKVAVSAHRDAVKLFTDAARNARDADVKAFAEKNLPALQGHLEKGRALRTTVLNSHPSGWLGDHKQAPVAPVSPASPTAPPSVVPGK